LFAAYFWPNANADKLVALTKYLNWFVFWDDEIDCGALQFNGEATDRFCSDTLEYLRHCIEPDVYGPATSLLDAHPRYGGFKELGDDLQIGQSTCS
jgi:hypothetical protein